MNSRHIIRLLEEKALSSLSRRELEIIQAHLRECADCDRAYLAARAASRLVRERLAAIIEPSPFFATRVMAALREQQTPAISPLVRLWRAAGTLVYSMAAVVLLLGALTVFDSETPSQPAGHQPASSLNDSADFLLEPASVAANDLSYGQVIETIYDVGE